MVQIPEEIANANIIFLQTVEDKNPWFYTNKEGEIKTGFWGWVSEHIFGDGDSRLIDIFAATLSCSTGGSGRSTSDSPREKQITPKAYFMHKHRHDSTSKVIKQLFQTIKTLQPRG